MDFSRRSTGQAHTAEAVSIPPVGSWLRSRLARASSMRDTQEMDVITWSS
jgi:hypothetical protein